MVASPRLREGLTHWENELYTAQIKYSTAKDPFLQEHWLALCNHATKQILTLEKELYSTP